MDTAQFNRLLVQTGFWCKQRRYITNRFGLEGQSRVNKRWASAASNTLVDGIAAVDVTIARPFLPFILGKPWSHHVTSD
jgi:hypothetical protein